MGLRVRFVESLHQIVTPVTEYLESGARGADLFEPQYLIVPTAGVRAWLTPQLARHLGAQQGRTDGIVSNVKIGYVGMINALLRNGVEDEDDPWSIEQVTMALLPTLSTWSTQHALVKKYHGPLRAARAMADRFDRYAARRPSMIREWEDAFVAGGQIGADNAMVEWQFDLWCAARRVIGTPPWPARTRDAISLMEQGGFAGLPRRLMIAGLESLTAANLELIKAMSRVMDIDIVCVHPSTRLAHKWAGAGEIIPVTPARAPKRPDDESAIPGAHVLPVTWMRGSHELQSVLSSQGIESPVRSEEWTRRAPELLGRIQSVIRDPFELPAGSHGPNDHSVQIHRAHNLARQVDILRDALLHAFNELKNLRPDEIVVLCADIESAAPLLQAVFNQPITIDGRTSLKIPLRVADRSLRDVDEGAELLAAVLALLGSRYDISGVMRVAANNLVLRHLRMGEDEVATWSRYAEVTRVRWGLDVDQRAARNFNVRTVTEHTWKQAIDRALLGALLPDAVTPAHELGGNVPLEGMDSSEIDALSGLAHVLGALSRVEDLAVTALPVSDWCDHIEELLVTLCGPSCTEIDDSLAIIDHFRIAVNSGPAVGPNREVPVAFEEFADLLNHRLSQTPGHQPLRTGATVATSFVPLRSVPFRVVCIVGLDDGTLAAGESEGDDIVAQEQLMGDPDPRLEIRRVLMDALLAAEDRLIVTCTGRSIKNNTPVPLVTPLAELVDLCGALGVTVHDDPEKLSGIEHQHPRHATGMLNFFSTNAKGDHDSVPVPGIVWSHDPAALSAARLAGKTAQKAAVTHVPAARKETLQLRKLETLLVDPLDYYMKETLRIYREYEEPDPGALLPVDIKPFAIGRAAEKLIEHIDGKRTWPDSEEPGENESPQESAVRDAWAKTVEAWGTVLKASDLLPVSAFGVAAMKEAERVAKSVWGAALGAGVPAVAPANVKGRVDLGTAGTVEYDLVGVVDNVNEPFVYSVRFDKYVDKEREKMKLRLLLLRAAGANHVKTAVLVYRNEKTTNAVVETITLADAVTQQHAVVRLMALANAEPIARTVPCGRFGDTGALLVAGSKPSDADVEATFGKYVSNDYSYPKSSEHAVFGPDPAVEDAFPKRPTLQVDVFAAIENLYPGDDLVTNVKVVK